MEDEDSLSLDWKTLGNLRVVDLKQELDKRGLSKSGSKKDLVKRLKQQLEFEKLCEERKLSGDGDLKKELDAVTEQNEFVQQYLAQQQKRYAEQKEMKRLLELEELHGSGDEKDICNSPNENEKDEDDDIIVVAEVPAGQSKNGANCEKILIDIASSPPSIEDCQPELEKSVKESSNPITVASPLIETSETGPSCGQDQNSNMEPATQFPSVPYSLSDIQLPESPGSQLPKSQKSVTADTHVLNSHSEKSGNTVKDINSDSETHSNGVCTSSDLTAVNNKNSSSEELTSEINEVNKGSKSDTNMESKSSETAATSERKGSAESDQSDSSDENSDKNEDSRQKSKIGKDDQDTSSNAAPDSEVEHNKGVKDIECDEKRTKDQSEESENEKSSDSDEYQRRSTKAKDNISSERAPKRRSRRNRSSTDSHSSRSSESSPEQDSSRDVPVLPKHKSSTVSREDNSTVSISEKSEDEKPRQSQRKTEKGSTHSGSMPPRQRLKIKRDNIVMPEIKRAVDDDLRRPVAAKDAQSTNIPSTGKTSVTVEPAKEESSDVSDTPSKVSYTPRKVSLSSRKINRKSEDEKKNDDSKPKRSKWGSFGTVPKASQTISISTDSLKNWFPDFKLINEPVPVNELVTEEPPPPVKEEKSFNNITDLMDTESSSVKHFATNRKEMPESESQLFPNEEPVEQGPTSKIIFIQNLVRPFTLHQLKELLKQNGNIVEEQFWIDKIKSKCFVTYESEEDAIKAKNALNGTRWPSSNPKILSAEFASEDELEFHRRGSEPPKPIPEQLPEKIESYERTVLPTEEHRKKDRDRRKERERSKPQQPVREWDKDKILQDSPEREHIVSKETEKIKSSEKKEKKDSKKRPNEDTPAKLLDDLFQKTKSSPCIYWLPLTEEQVKQREEAKRARRIEREKRNQLEKETEETDRRNKRARSGHRSREMENRRSSTRSRSPISRRR